MTDGPPVSNQSPKIDTTIAHTARIWNYWLGGKDNYPVDREVGDQIRRLHPPISDYARADRAFLVRAVRYLAGEAGIRQFLDIGTGLPTAPNTHQVAQAVAPESRVVYTDNDPLVLAHARALLTSSPEGATAYLDTDLHDPGIAAISTSYKLQLASGTGARLLSKRYVDDSKVSDHHAIIPTAVSPEKAHLAEDEHKIYDLICRRFLMMWHDDYLQAVTTVITAITNGEIVDRYRTTGNLVQQMGWKVLDIGAGERRQDTRGGGGEESPGQILPLTLATGQFQDVIDIEAKKKKTRPPKRFTEGTLLTAMQTAGQSLDERELSEAMKETGLGTPATRAATIEVLLKRGFIVRTGKNLEATEKGIHLIEVVHPEVKSPAMTGQWEAFLKKIQLGESRLEPFLDGISQYVRSVVSKVGQTSPVRRASVPETSMKSDSPDLTSLAKIPTFATLTELLQNAFGFSKFRPNQEAVCEAVTAGHDALLVMPTGSGKSLCYQLPGLARGGTTLVISPLIALMDDQVHKLKERGFTVECIHSGRDRETSRRVCSEYLSRKLQFLFIAPERLRVAGFPEMLAKRKPSLIAIDEAHCISQWGHDFRPDYRMLGQYLPSLRPAPLLALTATATPLVQRDIATQLGLIEPTHFIHGFRRENIGVEIVEALPSHRPSLAREILIEPNTGRRSCTLRPASKRKLWRKNGRVS